MRKWLFIITGLALLVCILFGISIYDYAYNVGYFNASLNTVPTLQQGIREGYHTGYNQAMSDIGYECCDICARYPTETEVLTFLKEDDTDTIPYVKGEFICTDYTDQLIERAWRKNLPAWLVLISFDDNYVGHAIVVFDIRVDTDTSCSIKQLFIEPQSDIELQDVAVGKLFNLCDGNSCKLCTIGRIRIYK